MHLTTTEQKIYDSINTSKGLTYRQLSYIVYGDDDQKLRNTLKVIIFHLRNKLVKEGIDFVVGHPDWCRRTVIFYPAKEVIHG